MKKAFEAPDFEAVHFGGEDIVTTSNCCDVAGIVFPTNDQVCPSGDAECTCGNDLEQNCATK